MKCQFCTQKHSMLSFQNIFFTMAYSFNESECPCLSTVPSGESNNYNESTQCSHYYTNQHIRIMYEENLSALTDKWFKNCFCVYNLRRVTSEGDSTALLRQGSLITGYGWRLVRSLSCSHNSGWHDSQSEAKILQNAAKYLLCDQNLQAKECMSFLWNLFYERISMHCITCFSILSKTNFKVSCMINRQ